MESLQSPAFIETVRASHNAWWDRYWAKSALSLPTSPDIERFWYGALYLWACTERGNYTSHLPPAGLWKNHYTGLPNPTHPL